MWWPICVIKNNDLRYLYDDIIQFDQKILNENLNNNVIKKFECNYTINSNNIETLYILDIEKEIQITSIISLLKDFLKNYNDFNMSVEFDRSKVGIQNCKSLIKNDLLKNFLKNINILLCKKEKISISINLFGDLENNYIKSDYFLRDFLSLS